MPPVFSVPAQPVTWLGRKQFFMWKVKNAKLSPTLTGSLPGVIGYVWRSGATGERRIFLANLTAQPQTVRCLLDGRVRELRLMPRELMSVEL